MWHKTGTHKNKCMFIDAIKDIPFVEKDIARSDHRYHLSESKKPRASSREELLGLQTDFGLQLLASDSSGRSFDYIPVFIII